MSTEPKLCFSNRSKVETYIFHLRTSHLFHQIKHVWFFIENVIFSSQGSLRKSWGHIFHVKLGGGGVQGQVKGQRLMSNIVVNDYIWLATCQGRIYEK